ncbi:MAG: VOC family protein [Rhodospirillales bacterium]|jgi:catechol-2,3-dioxygenase
MIKVKDVTYARFRAPDLDVMEAYLLDFGLLRTARDDNALYMRASDGEHHVHITETGAPAFVGFAFEAASLEDLHVISEAAGASPLEPMDAPGGGARVVLKDPDGFQVEIIHGMETLARLPVAHAAPRNSGSDRQRLGATVRVAPGPAKCKRLGHVVLNVTDFAASDAFYKSHFGLISSDELYDEDGVIRVAFSRCDRGPEFVDHHTLLTVPAEAAGLGHVAFEVEDSNDLFAGHEYLQAQGHRHSWGIGRHVLGSQIFDYWFDPFGFRLEHWTDGDLFNQDTPMGRHPMSTALDSQWGATAADRKV